MLWKGDFHNHSCLSPCGSLEMSPGLLVDLAVKKGIHILALSDHNSARNTPGFEVLCHRAGILPLCGIEVATQEELHCLALFETASQALDFGRLIEDSLIKKVPLNREKWGDQVFVDEKENILGEVDYFLNVPSRYTLEELGRLVLLWGGLFIPAHIDRTCDSISSQLGYLPPLRYSALEVRENTAGLFTGNIPLVKGSDAHHPDGVGTRTCTIELPELSWKALSDFLKPHSIEG